MSLWLLALVAFFAVTSAVSAWILFWGGAEWLEGSVLSAFLVHRNAPRWSQEGIKLVVGFTWLVEAIWFVTELVN